MARVEVAWEEEEQAGFHSETDFSPVVIGRTKLNYDRKVEAESAPGEAEYEAGKGRGNRHTAASLQLLVFVEMLFLPTSQTSAGHVGLGSVLVQGTGDTWRDACWIAQR